MKFRKEIIEADKILHEAAKVMKFTLFNPVNEVYVRKQFLAGKVRHPKLKYNIPKENLLKLRRDVSAINIDERDPVDTLIVEKQRNVIRKIDLLNSLGCFDFTEKSKKIWHVPKAPLVRKAYELLDEQQVIYPIKRVLAKDALQLFHKNLKHFKLSYKIKRGNLVNSCIINPLHKEIILRKKARFSEYFLNRLIVHEIGAHIFRYENARRQKLRMFQHGVADYLETEEGLAVYNEQRFGLLRQSTLRNYAGRVIAVHMAQEASLYDTYRELRHYFDKKVAFQLALRAKRGLEDTSLPGGYTKDAVYLRGHYLIQNFVKRKGNVKELYAGKIALNDIPSVKQLGFTKPKLIPNSFFLFQSEKGKRVVRKVEASRKI